jgi:hypothetical protein
VKLPEADPDGPEARAANCRMQLMTGRGRQWNSTI